MKKISMAFGSIVVVAILVSAALIVINNLTSSSSTAGDESPTSVIDGFSRKVNITSPNRIVSCCPFVTETIYALEIEDRLVGVTDSCDYPQDVVDRKASSSLYSIGGWSAINTEAILNLTPDLVILDQNSKTQPDILGTLETMGVKVVVTHYSTNISQVYKNIQMVGDICNRSKEAKAIIQEMENMIEDARSLLSNQTSIKKVAMVTSVLTLKVAGSETFVSSILDELGLVNAFGSVNGTQAISLEAMVEANPDVIIYYGAKMMKVDSDTINESISSNALWSQVKAIQDGSMFYMYGRSGAMMTRAGPAIAEATVLTAVLCYPTIYGKTIPTVISDDYAQYLP